MVFIDLWFIDLGGSINRGTPIAGWFTTENATQIWMIGGFPYFRKPPFRDLVIHRFINGCRLDLVIHRFIIIDLSKKFPFVDQIMFPVGNRSFSEDFPTFEDTKWRRNHALGELKFSYFLGTAPNPRVDNKPSPTVLPFQWILYTM